MSELAAVAAVLRSVADVAAPGGALNRRYIELHQRAHAGVGPRDPDLRTSVFAGKHDTAGAGVDATLLARLPDGRRVSWMIEVWIDTWEPGGPWSAVVKGDVDRDLTDQPCSDEECLLLEQRTVHDVASIQAAVLEMAELVVAYDVT